MGELSRCGHVNRPDARFCAQCGASLAAVCSACGHPAAPAARFCDECGSPLAGSVAAPAVVSAPAAGERKQVTVLFADVVASMDLAQRLDPDVWSQIMNRLFTVGADAVRRFGGTVDKFTGDGLMALFGAPVAQEDHATRAAHAGLALRAAARDFSALMRTEHSVDLAVRIGLNSGEVVTGAVGDSAFTAVGHPVGLAQRMEAAAAPGAVCVSETTAELIGAEFRLHELGPLAVKGVAAPVRAFVLEEALRPSGGRRHRTGSVRMVGREGEWSTLTSALDVALSGRAQVVGIVGEAGAGKSRLTEELAQFAAAQGVLVRRCAGVSHAGDVALLPIGMLFRDYYGITDADGPAEARAKLQRRLLDLDAALVEELPLMFDFLGVPDPQRPAPQLRAEERRRRVLEVIRRITQRRSERTPLLMVLEDLQWFDPTSIEFVDAWLPSFPGTRTLIVTNFRPEFRPPWSRYSYYRQLPLPALDDEAVQELLTELLGDDEQVAALTGDLTERSGGNPFFIEEIVRGWAEDGTLSGERGAYRLARPIRAVTVPATVQSVLAARIDRLSYRQKLVLQAASAIGRTFTTSVLAPVTELSATELDETLHELCGAELIVSTDQLEYRFWHPLTQEVAYAGLLQVSRQRLHRAVAVALIDQGTERLDELAALIATHYAAAADDLEAARWQIRAGSSALRADHAEAQRRWRAAIGHLNTIGESADSLTLGVRARVFLLRFGVRTGMDPTEVDQLLAHARAAAERVGDPAVLAGVRFAEFTVSLYFGDVTTAQRSIRESAAQADRSGDPGLRAWVWTVVGMAGGLAGPVSEGLGATALAADLCGDDPTVGTDYAGYRLTEFLPWVRGLVLLASGDLEEARRLLEVSAAGYEQRPVAEFRVWNLTLFAHLADCTGRPEDLDRAAETAPAAARIAADSGSLSATVKAQQALGLVALRSGRSRDARAAFEESLVIARKHRTGLMDEANVLAHLARAHLDLGDATAARHSAEEAIAVARRQGAQVVECLAHLVLARVLRRSSTSAVDQRAAHAAVAAGTALAERTGAATWAAFLAEEGVRLTGGDLAKVAEGYAAIGATEHARRIRDELAGCLA